MRRLRERWDALDTLALVRSGLLLLSLGAVLVTAVELAFLGHWDGTLQLLPWVALAMVTVGLLLVAIRPDRWRIRVAQALAVGGLVMGAVGVAIHIIENHDAGVLDFRYTVTWPVMDELGRWWLAATGTVGPSPPLAPASLSFAAALVILASLRRGSEPALIRAGSTPLEPPVR
jgi:hypothetical protein